MYKQFARAITLCLVLALTIGAQAPGMSEVYAQIRAEETSNSKIMWIIHEIADVHGPRVTGSPQLKSAQAWAVKTLNSFGLANAHLEKWTFQPPSAAKPVQGWDNVALTADAVQPFRGQLMVKPLAWTPSTKGVVLANVVMLTPPGLARPGGGGGARPAAAPSRNPPPMPAAPTESLSRSRTTPTTGRAWCPHW